jgi:hypothetical protein
VNEATPGTVMPVTEVTHGHPSLGTGESILWHALANWGDDNTRQVAGRLFVTNRRIVFVPNAFERFTGEPSWECLTPDAGVSISPGSWTTRVPVIRSIALRSHVTVTCPGFERQHFWLTSIPAVLKERMRGLPIRFEHGSG